VGRGDSLTGKVYVSKHGNGGVVLFETLSLIWREKGEGILGRKPSGAVVGKLLKEKFIARKRGVPFPTGVQKRSSGLVS